MFNKKMKGSNALSNKLAKMVLLKLFFFCVGWSDAEMGSGVGRGWGVYALLGKKPALILIQSC